MAAPLDGSTPSMRRVQGRIKQGLILILTAKVTKNDINGTSGDGSWDSWDISFDVSLQNLSSSQGLGKETRGWRLLDKIQNICPNLVMAWVMARINISSKSTIL